MKAYLFHHNINSAGGELTVALETLKALEENGFNIQLNTIEKPNFHDISKSYGRHISNVTYKSLLPFRLRYFGIYQRLLEFIPTNIPNDVDIIFNTSGGFLPFNVPSSRTIITYIHFPPSLMTSPITSSKYSTSLKWKVYFKPYQYLSSRIINYTLSKSNICIANSEFTRKAIKEVYPQIDPIVIYPPVDIDKFKYSFQNNTRKNQVVVISRFSPEKQIEKAIRVAKKLESQGFKFKIMGSLLPSNVLYFNKLQKMVSSYHLEDKVLLRPNVPFEEIIRSMSESKVYLHTMTGDHFGIAIVESMAAGLVPIIPAHGGCSEIMGTEYQYDSLGEAATKIVKQSENYGPFTKEKMYERSKAFSSDEFRKKIKNCMEQIVQNSLIKTKVYQ